MMNINFCLLLGCVMLFCGCDNNNQRGSTLTVNKSLTVSAEYKMYLQKAKEFEESHSEYIILSKCVDKNDHQVYFLKGDSGESDKEGYAKCEPTIFVNDLKTNKTTSINIPKSIDGHTINAQYITKAYLLDENHFILLIASSLFKDYRNYVLNKDYIGNESSYDENLGNPNFMVICMGKDKRFYYLAGPGFIDLYKGFDSDSICIRNNISDKYINMTHLVSKYSISNVSKYIQSSLMGSDLNKESIQHDTNFSVEESSQSSKQFNHYHMTGYMTDDKGDNPIELSFDIADEEMKNVVYKNVRLGGKIRMKCINFVGSSNSIQSFSIIGKDGPKAFVMNVNKDNTYDTYTGNAVVGEKRLSVILSLE